MADFTYLLVFVFKPFDPMNKLWKGLGIHNLVDNLEENSYDQKTGGRTKLEHELQPNRFE